MEAAFPLATLEGQQDFALAVEVAVPLGIVGVAEVAPGVVMYALEPVEAALVARELIALDEGDEGLEVHPPELLIPFKLVTRMAETIHEVEDAAELLVPAVLNLLQTYLDSLLDELGTIQALAEVHDKPHRFDGMAWIELATVEAIDEITILAQGFDDKAELWTVEDIHDFVKTVVDGFLQKCSLCSNSGHGRG